MNIKFTENEEVETAIDTPVQETSHLQKILVNYVGNKKNPENDEVTVSMIVDTVAEDFPEFLLVVAEENWVRGYQQALNDMTFKDMKGKGFYTDNGEVVSSELSPEIKV